MIGVIPEALMARELAHLGLTDLRIVGSMHERKALMASLSDGFVALPGGIGTLEELFEVWTWSQLGLHEKPCALLDIDGFHVGLASAARPEPARTTAASLFAYEHLGKQALSSRW